MISLLNMGQRISLLDLHSSYQVVMIGLDNAGKSTTLYRLKVDQYVTTVPTIGFNCEKIKPSMGKAKGATFALWDVGGQEKLRPLWRSYIRHTDAVIFVVDSVDEERFEEAKLELNNLLRCSDLPSSVPILLFCNKQDLPGAKPESELEKAVGLSEMSSSHPVHALPCCAVTGEGLDDTFDVLLELIHKSRKLDKAKKKVTR